MILKSIFYKYFKIKGAYQVTNLAEKYRKNFLIYYTYTNCKYLFLLIFSKINDFDQKIIHNYVKY